MLRDAPVTAFPSQQSEVFMKKKLLISIAVIAALLMGLMCFLNRQQETGTIEGDYIEAEKLQSAKDDSMIVPVSWDYYLEDGRIYMRDLFDPDSRRILPNKDSEKGLKPNSTVLVYPDGTEWVKYKYYYTYDSQNRLISETRMSNVSDIGEEDNFFQEYRYSYEFGSNGKYYRMIAYEPSSAGSDSVAGRYVYHYDQNDYPSKLEFYIGDALMSYETYKCDTNGNIVRKDFYNYDGTLLGSEDYTYTSTGKVETHNEYGADGTVFCEEVNYYDSRDYLRKIVTVTHDFDYETGESADTVDTVVVRYADEDLKKLGKFEV